MHYVPRYAIIDLLKRNGRNEMTNLTEKEQDLYSAIENGMDEPGCGWLHEMADDGKSTSGVMSSLIKKGVITSQESNDYPGEYWVSIKI